ncbi:MAG: hypothetical protein IJK65_10425 [Clostridiales bacterium]|nr:hypothetical protein [Clostridiales bacterium]
MSTEAKELLSELKSAVDPNECLKEKYASFTEEEQKKLTETVGELERMGFLSVFWADDMAYHIKLVNERIEPQVKGSNEKQASTKVIIVGNNNSIHNSNIGINNSVSERQEKKSFWEKHPFALALITAILAGGVLMFSFWGKIVEFIEGLFF